MNFILPSQLIMNLNDKRVPRLYLLGVFFTLCALWFGYQENRVRQDHAKGDSCKHLKLGEENPLFEKEVQQIMPDLQGLLAKLMDRRVQGKLDDPNPQGRYKRVQHPVGWGCAAASVEILPMNSTDRHGVFAQPATYKSVIRLSKNSFDPDNSLKISSISVKMFGVKGERLPLHQTHPVLVEGNKDTQDFIFISNPTLPFVAEVKELIDFHEWFIWGNTPGVIAWVLLYRPTILPHLLSMIIRGKSITNPFLVRQYSIEPNLLGPGQAIRLGLFPCDESQQQAPPPSGKANFVQEITQAYLNENDVCMKLMIQKQTDACKDQIDDILHEWTGPFQHVGFLRLAKGTQLDNSDQACDNLSFNPFHGLEANRPLGWVARVRKEVYTTGSDRRMEKNEGK